MRKLAVILAFGAIVMSQALADEAELERLNAARERWQSVQGGDYRYGYQRQCECYRDGPPVAIVTVRGGRVEDAYYRRSDREVPAGEENLDLYSTIDELFDRLVRAIGNDAAVGVEYHATEGYPTSVLIDYDTAFAGDEIEYRLTELEIL